MRFQQFSATVRMLSGSAFQVAGPAWENARSLNLVCSRGTVVGRQIIPKVWKSYQNVECRWQFPYRPKKEIWSSEIDLSNSVRVIEGLWNKIMFCVTGRCLSVFRYGKKARLKYDGKQTCSIIFFFTYLIKSRLWQTVAGAAEAKIRWRRLSFTAVAVHRTHHAVQLMWVTPTPAHNDNKLCSLFSVSRNCVNWCSSC